jgi:hypothetical protein
MLPPSALPLRQIEELLTNFLAGMDDTVRRIADDPNDAGAVNVEAGFFLRVDLASGDGLASCGVGCSGSARLTRRSRR